MIRPSATLQALVCSWHALETARVAAVTTGAPVSDPDALAEAEAAIADYTPASLGDLAVLADMAVRLPPEARDRLVQSMAGAAPLLLRQVDIQAHANECGLTAMSDLAGTLAAAREPLNGALEFTLMARIDLKQAAGSDLSPAEAADTNRLLGHAQANIEESTAALDALLSWSDVIRDGIARGAAVAEARTNDTGTRH